MPSKGSTGVLFFVPLLLLFASAAFAKDMGL